MWNHMISLDTNLDTSRNIAKFDNENLIFLLTLVACVIMI